MHRSTKASKAVKIFLVDAYRNEWGREGECLVMPREEFPTDAIRKQMVDLCRQQEGTATSDRRATAEDIAREKARGIRYYSDPISVTSVVEHLIFSFASTAAAVAFIRAAGGVIREWQKARATRRIKYKKDRIIIETTGTFDEEEVVGFIKRIESETRPQEHPKDSQSANRSRQRKQASKKPVDSEKQQRKRKISKSPS